MSEKQPRKNGISKRTLLATILIIFIIPVTILFGVFVLNDRKYYFISLLIIIYTMIPFVMVFENRKPKARELIVIAVLSAIAVAGRGAFFMLPQFKPVVAIVIITGVCFGAESGFLVGAVTGFVSNFFFGQGPWTPWQMFCFGIIGFIAGILYKKGFLKKTKLSLCVFGGLATFLIYGGIINIASLLIFTSQFSWKALLATYISGFWFDMVHAIATVFFLYTISQPMIEKLERIKIKYGLIETEDETVSL
ncbi:MAG: ECF transporter S component [Thermoanaerobacteraceae bacterium]|nr:ECF transporter S component [Thermoanaerobacteraceae bacterium]